ncbi:PH domain-containing protein [Chryseomicrobium sp. FSL W7-1435]|uniref:PH domain-containing protein n=1 Tax=Chryseomicrobium sp. FSL W7-1435 TaxID=2921704 RepID=UPI003159CF92
MLKKFASDALGISDIGKIIDPQDYDKTQSDDYVRHEDQEEIYFLIKTKSDEYCFTNLALIHVDGESAISSKRLLKRYSYHRHPISNVMLETAGTVDLDVEIKFQMGTVAFDIDVDKKQLERLKDLYKSLLYIAEEVYENESYLDMSRKSVDLAASVLHNTRPAESQLSEDFARVNEYAFNWMKQNKETYVRKDFGEVFKKYILN